jgi:CRISPR-associated protein Cas1
MFEEKAPTARSIEQLRGLEGGKVKVLYKEIASSCGVEWTGRDINSALSSTLNRAISGGNAALYGLVESVILALGYSPAIGFVHTGDPRSFVFDIADCLKFRTVVPAAMLLAKESDLDIEGRIRRRCRDLFMEEKMSQRIVTILDEVCAL